MSLFDSLRNIWKDPVWSKVIANTIWAILILFAGLLISKYLVNHKGSELLILVLTSNINLNICLFLLFLILAFISGIIYYKNISKSRPRNTIDDQAIVKFRSVFGNDVITEYNIAYPFLKSQPVFKHDGSLFDYPFTNADSSFSLRVDNPVPIAEVKSTINLSQMIFKVSNKTPNIVSDLDIKNKIDLSYCSIGGGTLNSLELINSELNIFYEFNHSNNVSVIREKMNIGIFFQFDSVYDYAIILRLRSKLFPNRVHMCIAGMAEWGTSGASWYLSNKWTELEQLIGNKDFGAVIKVRKESDQSAQLVVYRTQ